MKSSIFSDTALQVVVGDLPLEDVRYSEDTKKLLLRLADTCDT